MATAGQAELNQRKGFVQEGQYVNDGIPQGYPQSHPPQGAYTTGKPGEGPPYVQGQNVDELGRKKTRDVGGHGLKDSSRAKMLSLSYLSKRLAYPRTRREPEVDKKDRDLPSQHVDAMQSGGSNLETKADDED
ncbi:hypothetical protein AXG93_2884s1040 [Marchantia polymorpha subsp. ruderalis]|uniref:Uncharacterized protein n=1 Tax=Marchantia polymorpha subsp. ruderalis TaxID=1480154 RepID=A0A176WN60_MARPO|nr:hypothetical protein AXG93_2884s1040 [Marchantia polymorpha subsp. ruderalis]